MRENSEANLLTLLKGSRLTACGTAAHLEAFGATSIYLGKEQMGLSLHQDPCAGVRRSSAGRNTEKW